MRQDCLEGEEEGEEGGGGGGGEGGGGGGATDGLRYVHNTKEEHKTMDQ